MLYALGIDEVGENVAKLLAKYYKNFNELLADREKFTKLQNINGVGEEMINSLVAYFNNEKNFEMIQSLMHILDIRECIDAGKSLNGESVVFTGALQTMTRQQVKMQAEQLGYKVLTTISKNTTYLVCGEKAGSKLKKAQEMGIKILSEEEWKKTILQQK